MSRKYLVLVLCLLAGCAWAQETYPHSVTDTGIAHLTFMTNQESVQIHNYGPKMFTITDKDGKVTLEVMRDGSVKGDAANLDENAKRFWQLMAKYMQQFCKPVEGEHDGQ